MCVLLVMYKLLSIKYFFTLFIAFYRTRFIHVHVITLIQFLTSIFQVIFRLWKVSMRSDQKAHPVEMKDSHEDFLYDERAQSENYENPYVGIIHLFLCRDLK